MDKGRIFAEMEKRTGLKSQEFYLHTDKVKSELRNIPLSQYHEEEWVDLLFHTFIEKSDVFEDVMKNSKDNSI